MVISFTDPKNGREQDAFETDGEKITASELPGTPVGSQFAPLLQLLFSAPVHTFIACAAVDKNRNIPVTIIDLK
jgi:hypothetical protein